MKANFPPVLVKLIGEGLKDDPDFKVMARIIGMDPALTTTTLSLVNSPYYGLNTEVSDLERAAVVLGNKELLRLAFSVSFHGKLKDQLDLCRQNTLDNWSLVIWSASASQLLATRLCPEQANQAYLCALIKDISLLMLCSAHPEALPELPDNQLLLCLYPGQLDKEKAAWGMDHCQLSVDLLREWDIPISLCSAIAHHHDFHALDQYDDLTRTVILATRWAEVEHQARDNPGALVQFKSLLGRILSMGDEELNQLRNRCIEQYKVFHRTLTSSENQLHPEVRVTDMPLDELQSLFLMSLDLQNAAGGLTTVAEFMALHLKLWFSISEWELVLVHPDFREWSSFSFLNGRIATSRSGDESLLSQPRREKGLVLPLVFAKHRLGRMHIPENGVEPETRTRLSVYARLISQSYDHYLRSQAVMELKARTLDTLPLGVARLDDHETILDANGMMLSFLDHKGEVVGKAFWEVLSDAKGVAAEHEWERFIRNEDQKRYNRVFCPLGPDAGLESGCFYISAHKNDDPRGVLVLVEDISEITDLQFEAVKQREYLENLLRSMQDLVLTLDEQGVITFSSSPAAAQLMGRNFFEISRPMGLFMEEWGPRVLKASEGPVQIILNLSKKESKPLEIVITPLRSFHNSFMIVGRDLSTILRLEEKIRRQAIYDHLTGVFNRHQFQVFLTREVDRSSREGTMLGVIFFDVDRLKDVNDRLGHAAGDELLRELGHLLQKVFRKGMDFPCRYGGDEFIVLLTGLTSPEILVNLADRLLEKVKLKFDGKVGLSIGLAILEKGEDSEAFVGRADDACYQAKVNGGNRYVWAV
jgi:diguanylate cyclase (GGDEF)-like protein